MRNVRHWTLEEAESQLEHLKKEIEVRDISVEEFRSRGEEWSLEPHDRKLLAAYERFSRMVAYASGNA